jgi:hypothetical protein
MKTKNKKIKILIDSLGNGAREAYLEMNPHGFSAVNKVHKNSKKYDRKKSVKDF